MSAALFIALSIAASGACAAISWKHPAQVARATGGDLTALARSLRALPAEARLSELARRSPPESWERRLALEVMSAADPRAKIAAANDLLAELEQRLDAGAGWPRAAARLSALAALLLATLSFLAQAGPSAIALALVAGAAGAIASAAAGRAGRAAASRTREAVDALVGVALGPLDGAAGAPRAPRASPRRARRAPP
ncbi:MULTISPECIES: hypothetical protein [Sorangium]|uniref:Secreted protein n=1 Tax=Sorangium cellulosum TaxID=56 RepID=A0A4P2QXN7_SORCE|nr:MULTISPECIES: hypothetical protein [Sorangium]AUX35327.1 hypothetical protein SOCE836_075180 [Sorangium cellulosum]WCQ94631.1 hypothetical protein NQZ70_07399 [Sorangium sp. Soce836]